LLVGHSAGADQLMRMTHDEDGPGVEVDGLIALGPNVSLDTCFATRLYAKVDAANSDGTLKILKSLAEHIDSLETWLVVQSYFAEMFIKLGNDLEPLRRYAADLVRPFEQPGDPLGPQGSGLSSGAGSCSVGSGETSSARASSDLAAAARLSRRACFASRFACARAFRFCSF